MFDKPTGRTYTDFLDFTVNHLSLSVVQLDTLIGHVGGKVILTVHFLQSDFMAGLLLENKTAAETAHKLKTLKERLWMSGFRFGEIVPLILTDNGGEFSIVSAFENDEGDNTETRLFFCNPCVPYEKPHIEKNHSLFRDILPSGSSFDSLTQSDVNLVFSHVNAVKRRQFNGKSAFDIFTFTFSFELAAAFGIEYIPPELVQQSPKLLR